MKTTISTHLTQLTESWCAFFTAFICLFEIGSKRTIAFFSQAATIRLLQLAEQREIIFY